MKRIVFFHLNRLCEVLLKPEATITELQTLLSRTKLKMRVNFELEHLIFSNGRCTFNFHYPESLRSWIKCYIDNNIYCYIAASGDDITSLTDQAYLANFQPGMYDGERNDSQYDSRIVMAEPTKSKVYFASDPGVPQSKYSLSGVTAKSQLSTVQPNRLSISSSNIAQQQQGNRIINPGEVILADGGRIKIRSADKRNVRSPPKTKKEQVVEPIEEEEAPPEHRFARTNVNNRKDLNVSNNNQD